jgi:hypothetical protein
VSHWTVARVSIGSVRPELLRRAAEMLASLEGLSVSEEGGRIVLREGGRARAVVRASGGDIEVRGENAAEARRLAGRLRQMYVAASIAEAGRRLGYSVEVYAVGGRVVVTLAKGGAAQVASVGEDGVVEVAARGYRGAECVEELELVEREVEASGVSLRRLATFVTVEVLGGGSAVRAFSGRGEEAEVLEGSGLRLDGVESGRLCA